MVSSKIDEFSFDNIKPADTWAVQDSMVNFLSQTQPDLPAQKINEIADNLDNNFEFIYRTSKNDSFFTDTLKTLLANDKYSLDDNLKDKLARNLDINFVFTKMSKESNQMSISRMCEVIDGCSTSIDSVLRDSIIAHIDNIYFFKSAEKKSSAGRIIIFGKEDSLDSGFEKYFQAKIKKIVSRGEEGELLFLAEMLNQAPKVMFLLLPVFALLLKLFYIRRRIFYINHLVFALHLHTLLFIYLLIPILFTYWYVVLLFFIVIAANTYIAFLKVYKQGRIKTFFKMNLIMLIYTFIISLSASLLVF